MSWSWRTKPRSILRTIQWFPFFGALENQNWDEKDAENVSKFDKSPIYPIRRKYIYNAHSEEDAFIGSLTFQKYLSGKYDTKEAESNGRNDKTTFEFFGFGYTDNKGFVKVTDVGRRIMHRKFDSEDFLKQLLKMHFPNNIRKSVKGFSKDDFVYPMELVCKAIKEFEYLNRSELALLFGCNGVEHLEDAFKAIRHFRTAYQALPNKNETLKVKALFKESYELGYEKIENQVSSYYDYAESWGRSLVYTGMFKATGRSLATKIRVPEYCQSKLDMILASVDFPRKEFASVDDYMQWYGDPDSIILPWDNVDARRNIIEEKIKSIQAIGENDEFIANYDGDIKELVEQIIGKAAEAANAESITQLKETENELIEFITNVKEREYIRTLSQTPAARNEIIDKYDEIMDTIDMGALWLEVNTWKSLLAITGDKMVKRNFNIEEDLTPKSFAPGIGNTPDMEMYTSDYIIIPEVSLMTGVQQWEHEASSVIDHVLSFIREYEDKTVLGLFISTSINIRTKWQFFILNRESWVGKSVPVIPLTIKQYKGVLECFYQYNRDINEFTQIIDSIRCIALKSNNFEDWFARTESFINEWKIQLASA